MGIDSMEIFKKSKFKFYEKYCEQFMHCDYLMLGFTMGGGGGY